MRIATTSTLALAISLGLGAAAMANEGVHKDTHDAKATMQAHAGQDAMHRGADASPWETRLGSSEAKRLSQEFRSLDRDNDGLVMIADIDGGKRTELQRFDLDDDSRLDRYEFMMAHSARFDDLDRDNDGKLSRSEVDAIKPEYVSFVALDIDNDQLLSEDEYRQFIESGDWARDRDRYAFGNVDRDTSGTIDTQEASVYVPLASSFTAYDPDGDGLIESTEYEVFLAEVDARQQRDRRVAGTDTQVDDDNR